MGPRSKPSRACVLALLALPILAPPSGAQALSARPVGPFPELEEALARPCEPVELRRRLTRLSADQLPGLFVLAAGGVLPGGGRSSAVALDEPERVLVRESMLKRPLGELVAFLEDLVTWPPTIDERLEAQDLLARIGSSDHLKLLVRLSVPALERGTVAPRLRVGFLATARRIMEREPMLVGQLPMLLSESPPGIGSAIVELVASSTSPETPHVLASLLGRVPGLDPLVLLRIAERGRLHPIEQRDVMSAVRRYLSLRDPALVCPAIKACGRIGDDEAVDTLITLSELGEPRVREHAFAALRDITGLPIGSDTELWERWYEDETRWWDESAEALLASIERGNGFEFSSAAREVLEHRLYRHRIADAFVQVLSRDDHDQVRVACSALAQLGSPVAVPALRECLQRTDRRVREVARRALDVLEGKELLDEEVEG